MIRLLFLGDIVGEPGRAAAKVVVSEMLKEGEVDFVVVNGENSAQGKGISPKKNCYLYSLRSSLISLSVI